MRDVQEAQSADAMRPHVPNAYATDGRTDARTKMVGAEVDQLSVVDARRGDGIESVGEVLARGIWPTGERHPVVRSGEREPIPNHVRSAVWFRDHGRCELCPRDGQYPKVWHLDHITPWSAGGSDESTNLRVLCETHNMDRGNQVDPTERPRMAVTWWCHRCYADDRTGARWEYHRWVVVCPIHMRTPNRCRVGVGYRRMFQLFDEVATWHERDPIAYYTTTAWCAHCGTPGLTDQPL